MGRDKKFHKVDKEEKKNSKEREERRRIKVEKTFYRDTLEAFRKEMTKKRKFTI